MGRNLQARRLSLISLIVLLAASCGRNGSDGSKRVAVQGKVTHRGAALQGGTIAFVPDVELGGRGDIATVEIKPDGTYTLNAAPGWYRITIKAAGLSACYADPELCQLSREVKAGSGNVHDFPLN